MDPMPSEAEIKRLHWRAHHRGTKEADLLRPYFESEMLRAIDTYEKKYKLKLDHPVARQFLAAAELSSGARA